MQNSNILSPIIILGTHRSGTSMISRFLESSGIFMGTKKDINHESTFFLNLNRWILKTSNSSWDNPDNVQYLIENPQIFSLTIDYLKRIINSPHIREYLGLKNYLKYRSLNNLDFVWGWKDPRNSYTLPLWLDIFPNAKIIHIYRHGLDVANSLKMRHLKGIEKAKILQRKRTLHYLIKKKKGGFTDSIICGSIEKGFELWEKYIQKSFEYENTISNKYLNIKYEDFLNHPEELLKTILEFCQISTKEENIKNIISSVNKDRAYAYKRNPDLLNFSEKVKDRLKKFGY